MIQEYHPISLNKSSFFFNSKDEDILEITESVFVFKLPNYNISPGRFEINNAPNKTKNCCLNFKPCHGGKPRFECDRC